MSCDPMPATFSWRRLTCLSVIVTRNDADVLAGGLRVRPGEEKWSNLAGGCVAAEEGALVVGGGQARHEGRRRPMQAAAVAHAAHARRHEARGVAERGVVQLAAVGRRANIPLSHSANRSDNAPQSESSFASGQADHVHHDAAVAQLGQARLGDGPVHVQRHGITGRPGLRV